MTKKCPKCNGPLRFVSKLNMINGMLIPRGIVGAECHDEKCRGNAVFFADDWMESLPELAGREETVRFRWK